MTRRFLALLPRCIAILLLTACTSTLYAADTVRALFIGNSYTYVNQMPELVKEMAAASSDLLYYQSSTPGGATLQQHCQNANTLSLIAQGDWDFVVLQEQSQLPAFPIQQVLTESFPFARQLDSLIHLASPCAKTVFYRTWGRENGDPTNCAAFPPLCTYEGMDSLLDLRYTMMADTNDAYLAPVGTVWHRIRDNHPQIDLYQADGSHPTAAGSFAAATCFYSLFFRKDPALSPYHFTLPAAEAAIIKQFATTTVFDSLGYWRRFNPLPVAAFQYTLINDSTISFQADSTESVVGYRWDFGDGSPMSFVSEPVHTFINQDSATVCLTVYTDCDSATTCQTIDVGTVGIIEHPETTPVTIYPNPFRETLFINGSPADYIGTIRQIDGRVLRKLTITVPATINLSALPPGTYLLTLKNDKGQIFHHQLIKRQ